ncbi:MAG: RHS repeat-associated core domain-containing protein [Bacteroidetes bacterium]|nr:RHS repeat-associated core domain-containing protein [Bacteroidota bacterium]
MANILSAQDYYPFGMLMPTRGVTTKEYRFAFNGKENDNEVKGTGNQQDYGFRIYDPRLGRFLSIDPLTKEFPWYTPYQFAGNNPIWAKDLDGLEEDIVVGKQAQTEPVLKLSDENQIKYELVRAAVDAYVEQVYSGEKNVGPEKQYAKAVITMRSFAVKEKNDNYIVVINITSPKADGKDSPVMDYLNKEVREEIIEKSYKYLVK